MTLMRYALRLQPRMPLLRFAVRGVNEFEKPKLVRPKVRRSKLLGLSSHMPRCPKGMKVFRYSPLGQRVPEVGINDTPHGAEICCSLQNGWATRVERCAPRCCNRQDKFIAL